MLQQNPLPLLRLFVLPSLAAALVLTQEVFGRHLDIVEEELGRVGGLQPDLVEIAPARKALGALGLHRQERDALGAFGKSILDFQNTKFKLAECKTNTVVARTFLDSCIAAHLKGELTVETAAMAKYWTTDLQNKVLDECVQLHGGYGFMMEYDVAEMWTDARVQRIYGGTNEIMKLIIARELLAD